RLSVTLSSALPATSSQPTRSRPPISPMQRHDGIDTPSTSDLPRISSQWPTSWAPSILIGRDLLTSGQCWHGGEACHACAHRDPAPYAHRAHVHARRTAPALRFACDVAALLERVQQPIDEHPGILHRAVHDLKPTAQKRPAKPLLPDQPRHDGIAEAH